MVCHDRASLSQQSPVALTHARALSRAHTYLSCAQPQALVRARCVVLLLHNFYVATQGLLALTTPCRDANYGRDTGGLCRNRETSVATLVTQSGSLSPSPVATPKLRRDTGSNNLYHNREFSVATDELWVVCRDRGAMGSLSRQAFRLVTPTLCRSLARSRSSARTQACRAHYCKHYAHVACASLLTIATWRIRWRHKAENGK